MTFMKVLLLKNSTNDKELKMICPIDVTQQLR